MTMQSDCLCVFVSIHHPIHSSYNSIHTIYTALFIPNNGETVEKFH